MLCLCFLSVHIDDDDEDEEMMNGYAPASHRLANSLGVSSRNMQVMKASFFGDDDDMDTAAPPCKLNPSNFKATFLQSARMLRLLKII